MPRAVPPKPKIPVGSTGDSKKDPELDIINALVGEKPRCRGGEISSWIAVECSLI